MDVAKVFHPSKSKYLVLTTDYLLPISVCLGVISLFYFILYSPFFNITTINCSLDYQDCQDPSLLIELNKLKGQNIFRLSTSSISSRLTSLDFTIRASIINKVLPGTLNFELQSVYPVVALKIGDDSTWVILDSLYRVIGTRSSNPNVPTLIITDPLTLTVGRVPSDAIIVQSLGLARRLSDELFSLTSITLVDEDTIKLTLQDGKEAIFTPKKDEQTQLRALQAILKDATITKGVSTIDVRFSQPVLR